MAMNMNEKAIKKLLLFLFIYVQTIFLCSTVNSMGAVVTAHEDDQWFYEWKYELNQIFNVAWSVFTFLSVSLKWILFFTHGKVLTCSVN